MITETLPKLQQYFLTQGVYIYFVDFHFNWHFDWTTNPYHVQRILDELHDAHRTSAGPFFLVKTIFSSYRSNESFSSEFRRKSLRIFGFADRIIDK